MAQRVEIRLSGSGEQGVILAGVILAEAAALYDDRNAVQSQSYGPEARGGASRSEVIVSDDEIDDPKTSELDVLVTLTQEACDKYVGDLRSGGLLLVDMDLVQQVPAGEHRVVGLPLSAAARDRVGKASAAHIVTLGALVALNEVVTEEALENAVLSRVPKGTEDLHRKALAVGRDLAVASQVG